MLSTARFVAIDDEIQHLEGLARGLNECGAACLQIHFTGDDASLQRCPHVRVIFADLHMVGGHPADHKMDFSLLGSVLENSLKPEGPYFVVLWTKYPDQADALRVFLEDRLKEVVKPLSVASLDKSQLLDANGRVSDPARLAQAIQGVIGGQPQVKALLNWEERVLEAAADTVASIVGLAAVTAGDSGRVREVGRILWQLAVAGVGHGHVNEDRFHAVNEALLPILADRIGVLRSREGDPELWRRAFDAVDVLATLSRDQAARLNQLVHFATVREDSTGAERGSVIAFEGVARAGFLAYFGVAPEEAAEKEYLCAQYCEGDDRFRWVLVQAQAACDYAQTRLGPLPFYLGLDLLESCKANRTAPDALWRSPPFEFGSGVRVLHVSARFQASLAVSVAAEQKPLYRLREELLGDLVYRAHVYSARPGFIVFRNR